MNKRVSVPPEAYELLRGFLQKGIIKYDGKSIDFSPVQDVQISNGVITFNPPAKVTLPLGVLTIRTTVSRLTLRSSGIKVEIDNSPIDLEIQSDG